jgi:hypothetical protein
LGALSYRRSFDGAEYTDGNGVSAQKLNTSPPIVGVNVKNFMFAYTYSHVTGPVQFDGLSVGWNECDHCSKFIF